MTSPAPVLLLTPLAAVVVGLRRLVADPVPLLVLVVLLLLLPQRGAEDAALDVRPSDLALAALIALAGARLLLHGTGLERLRSAVVLPVAGIVVAGGLATLLAEDPATSAAGLVRVVEVFVLGPLAVLLVLRTARDARLLLGALVLLGLVQGALGTWQYATASGAGFGDETRRAVGTFGAYDIMALAGCVGYALVLLAAVAAVRPGRTRALAAGGALLLLLPLLFSLSRGALLATVVAVAAVLLLTGWRRAVRVGLLAALAGAVSLAALGGAAATVTDRLSSLTSTASEPDQSVQDRYALWAAARTMFADSPLTGTGLKGFAAARDSASPLDLSTGSDVSDGAGYRRVELLSPHSTYFLVLAEQGLAGALAFGALVLTLVVLGLRRWRRTPVDDAAHRLLGLSALGTLVLLLVDSVYADIGGATTVLLPLVLGLNLWWSSGCRLLLPRGPA